MILEDLTEQIIGCAIKVHRELGPGLLENLYETAMTIELDQAGLQYERQKSIPVFYKSREIGLHRLDLVVAGKVVVELKSVDRFDPLFDAQVLGYMKMGHYPVGLLINFNSPLLKSGIKRFVLDPPLSP